MYMNETKRNEENFRVQMESVYKMCHTKLMNDLQHDKPFTTNIKNIIVLLQAATTSADRSIRMKSARGYVIVEQNKQSKQVEYNDVKGNTSSKKIVLTFMDYTPRWQVPTNNTKTTEIPYVKQLMVFLNDIEARRAGQVEPYKNDFSKKYVWNLNYLRICLMRYFQCIIENNSEDQALISNGMELVSIVHVLCKLVDSYYYQQRLTKFGWRYKGQSPSWIRKHELMISNKLVGENPTLLFFDNTGTFKPRKMTDLTEINRTYYLHTMQYIVRQHCEIIFMKNAIPMEQSAVNFLDTINRRLQDLSSIYPRYGVESVKMDWGLGHDSYFNDIWPEIHTQTREKTDGTLYVQRILRLYVTKMKAKHDQMEQNNTHGTNICDPGFKLYNSMSVWRAEYLVVCMMRLMYVHLSLEPHGDLRSNYVARVADIWKLSFSYWRLVSGLYNFQNLLMPRKFKPNAQYKLEYNANR